MILVCDIGNTRIKTGFYDGDNISLVQSLANFEEFNKLISEKEFSDCIFSSVVPAKSEILIKSTEAKTGKTPFQVTHNSNFNLQIDYKTPETLGIDRICSAEGAYFLFNKINKSYTDSHFIISIDFGTATTVNFVKYPGIFPGGMILPGLSLMFDSLSQNTAQLPEVSEKDYTGIIGVDTKSSIANGVINAQIGLIEKTIAEIKNEFDVSNLHIYLTGGNAEKIIPFLKFRYEYLSELVLMGIVAVYKNSD
jgi:type III pantothenate kinase